MQAPAGRFHMLEPCTGCRNPLSQKSFRSSHETKEGEFPLWNPSPSCRTGDLFTMPALLEHTARTNNDKIGNLLTKIADFGGVGGI